MVALDTVRDALAMVRGRLVGDNVGIAQLIAQMSDDELVDAVVVLVVMHTGVVRAHSRMLGIDPDELLTRVGQSAEEVLW